MEKIKLRRSKRINDGHLWVFSNEILGTPKDYLPGSLVEVYSRDDAFLGIGYVNPASLISVRLLTREREAIDAGFIGSRISKALDYRKRFIPYEESYRAVFSEGDFLPGLIVDKYAGVIVVQSLTAGMEAMIDTVLEVLDGLLSPKAIVLRNDSPMRTLEGLTPGSSVVKGNLDLPPVMKDGELLFEVDPLGGQKTGFYLDQRQNRHVFASMVNIASGGGAGGLDLFCYTGAWAISAAHAGAYVTGVDSSKNAVAMAMKNARLNRLEGRCRFVCMDVFDFLDAEIERGTLYDFVIVDPPAFVKNRARIKEALRGYSELNAKAVQLVKPGGLLATSSCSYHVEKDVFLEIVAKAARGRQARLVSFTSQGVDHPILMSMPETQYLKCAIVELS